MRASASARSLAGGRSFRLRAYVVLAIACSTTAAPVFADYWYEHYERGVNALNAQRWEQAIREINEAVRKRGEPGTSVRTYGMNFIGYHPYLELGIAYFNVGRLDEALQAFDTEERYGAVAQSPKELSNLRTFRFLAEGAKRNAEATEQQRIARAVQDAIEESKALEASGLLDEAMAALGKGLAVQPRNTELLGQMQRLRDRDAERAQARENHQRVANSIKEAGDLMAASRYQEASSLLSAASILAPENQEVARLLVESQEKLRAQIEASSNAQQRTAMIRENLAELDRLEREGQLAKALELLQSVLALEPENEQAIEIRSRLANLQAQAEHQATLKKSVSSLLEEAERLLREGQYTSSVAGFYKAIGLDPDNARARNGLDEAYTAINRRIVAGGTKPDVPKLPPVIALGNAPTGTDDSQRPEERVASPDFALHGIIISDQPRVIATFLRDTSVETVNGQSPEEIIARSTDLQPEPMGSLYQFRFHQSFTIAPGLTLLTLRVDDSRGTSNEQSHRVRYVRPLTRSPWFYSALALLAVSVLGATRGYQVSRRNRLLQRRFNPYVAGAPVLDDDLFVGREALLSRILQTIHNNSILLYGERRIGKTTLQHHLRKRLKQIQDPEFVFYPVYIDLQGTPEDHFFRTLADGVFEELAPVLGGTRPSDDPPGQGYGYDGFVRDIHGVLKALRKRSSKRVKLVLLIDEIDELNNYDPRINQKLRSLFMKSFAEDLVAVVSGVGIKKHWASEGSPWYNFFEEVEVRPFTRDDARQLVEEPIRGVFRLEENALDRILDLTNCKPYLIQRVCIALVNRMHDQRRRRITVADVEAIWQPVEG